MRVMRIFDSFRDFIQPVRDQPQVGIMLAIVGLVMSGNALVAPVLSLYATTFASSSTLVGMVITIFGFARLFVNYPAGVLSQRIGRRPVRGAQCRAPQHRRGQRLAVHLEAGVDREGVHEGVAGWDHEVRKIMRQ